MSYGPQPVKWAWMDGYGLVTNIACSEHTEYLEKIEVLLGEAQAQGLSGWMAAKNAQVYLNRFTGISYQHPVLPSTCAKEVAAAKSHYNSVATMLNNAGGMGGGQIAPIVPLDQLQPQPPQDIAGTIKTVAIAAAVIAGVVVVAPVVFELVGMNKVRRRMAGYRRRSRR